VSAAPAPTPERGVLVVGASRGVGLELVRELLRRDEVDRVFAAARRPEASDGLGALRRVHGDTVVPLALDVEDEKSVAAAAERVRETGARLWRVLVTAGLLHDGEVRPEKRLEAVDPGALQRSFAVNAVGPLLVAKHFVPLMAHGEEPVFASLSARVGSIGDNRKGGWYGYRASKAAQNMLLKTLSLEVGRRHRGTIVVSLHPGTVESELSRPFLRRVPPEQVTPPERAARRLLAVIDSLRAEDSGSFLAYDGSAIPW